jgi:hypothetical protein
MALTKLVSKADSEVWILLRSAPCRETVKETWTVGAGEELIGDGVELSGAVAIE